MKMKLSAKSHNKLQEFFRRFFSDETIQLPPIQIHAGFWARLITKALKIHGITIGRHIFILPELVCLDEDKCKIAPEDLIVHEATHVIQYKKQGFFGFLLKYVWDFLVNLRELGKLDLQTRWQAYYNISHEVEARASADTYRLWNS